MHICFSIGVPHSHNISSTKTSSPGPIRLGRAKLATCIHSSPWRCRSSYLHCRRAHLHLIECFESFPDQSLQQHRDLQANTVITGHVRQTRRLRPRFQAKSDILSSVTNRYCPHWKCKVRVVVETFNECGGLFPGSILSIQARRG